MPGVTGVQNASFLTLKSHPFPSQVMLMGSRNEDVGIFLYRPLFEPFKHTDTYQKHHKCQEKNTQVLLINNLWIPSTRHFRLHALIAFPQDNTAIFYKTVGRNLVSLLPFMIDLNVWIMIDNWDALCVCPRDYHLFSCLCIQQSQNWHVLFHVILISKGVREVWR